MFHRRVFVLPTPIDGIHLNGKLTLGENIYNGGVRLAFMALMDSLKDKPQAKIDGYARTALFPGLGPGLVSNIRPRVLRMLVQVDLIRRADRVNGMLENMFEFRQAFAARWVSR